jgi:hypothetical protein
MSEALSVLLAGTLLAAALGKAGRGGTPVLVALEVAVAIALLAGGGRMAAVVAATLLVVFSFALRDYVRRGLPCPCFGAASDPRRGLVRNAGLLTAAGALIAWPAAALWTIPLNELFGAATVATGVTCVWALK